MQDYIYIVPFVRINSQTTEAAVNSSFRISPESSYLTEFWSRCFCHFVVVAVSIGCWKFWKNYRWCKQGDIIKALGNCNMYIRV